ncbi:tumor necrosis factor receptor superfamily member 9a [Pempheris klunzingeri]|uniref:tumor necrosis factor receptor superfamily member 9a n=1 Tax=Pempheris klunzingeri TaxID=3127111 RepID=UPI0039804193
MAVILWMMGLSLLMHGCLCSIGQADRGCMKWRQNGENVCCVTCHPGHHMFNQCGANPKDLCTPCEPGTFTVDPKSFRCTRCTQCVGAHVLEKECTATSDTKCGCKEGLTCGNSRCSFCVKTCGKGQEPTENRSCRPCPEGTFNDQIQQKCKPWSTKCPNPDQKIVAKGDTFTDIKCATTTTTITTSSTTVSLPTLGKSKKPDPTKEAQPLIYVITSIVLIAFSLTIIIISIIAAMKIIQRRRKETRKEKAKTENTKIQIIRTPTDDPRTLIAVECSFHEAQQEQGSSTESLDSKDSSDQLIA